ncbi:MAG: methyltransferase domain-containing protein [Chloroflexi bacterium]|nr:methyltransferase domain-containing protein [Chloroflexota bacterium]
MSNSQLRETQLYWDSEAASFDNEPDHGLRDPVVRQAWRGLLTRWNPSPPAKILDIGCGTGSLSLILARLGHQVTGIDLSPAMIAQAKTKAANAGFQISFQVMDASSPTFSERPFDGIVCRHLLWSLPDINNVLQNWVGLLRSNGRLLLIEGFWHTGGGLHADTLMKAMPPSLTNISHHQLSHQQQFWGREVDDERYAIMAEVKNK